MIMHEAIGRSRGPLGILLCPRCNQAFISESPEIVEVLLAVHIESCQSVVSFGGGGSSLLDE
jgi:hypothetical protein